VPAGSAYVRYAAFAGDEVVLQGGFPRFGPVRYDPQRHTVASPGARRLRYTTDGSYPVPIRPDWALSRTATTVEGDTLSLAGLVPAGRTATTTVHVVPIVVREDGKEALGDVYALRLNEVPASGTPAGGAIVLSPLAAVEDLSQKE
jgi:hypothetical protein